MFSIYKPTSPSYSPSKSSKSQSSDQKQTVVWEWFDTIWHAYDSVTQKKLEAEYQKNKQGSYTYTASNGQKYRITFYDMQQENLRTRFKRTVRRQIVKQVNYNLEEEEKGPASIEVDHSNKMSNALTKYFNKKDFSDFVFYSEDKPIYTHKIIINQRSEMLSELVKGKTEHHVDSKFRYPIVEACLAYLYSGKILITDENVNELLTCADHFQISELRAACFDFIVKSLDEDSVTEVLMKARKKEYDFDTTELISKCIAFISKQSEAVFQTKQFLQFDEDILISLCKSDSICVDEVDLFKAIVRWGKTRCKDQEKHSDLKEVLANILPHIRYPLITAEDLIKVVKPSNLVPFESYLLGMEYNASPDDFKDNPDPQFRDRGKVLSGSKLLNSKNAMILYKWIQKTRFKGKSWKLCYKASKDGFSCYTFHAKCDNVGPTIVVIQSTNGNIFGGFAGIDWASTGQYRTDPDCFLFSLVNHAGNPPTQIPLKPGANNHIYCSRTYGPTFGGGHDLYICGTPNTSTSNYSNLGYTYTLSGYNYSTPQIQQYLAGSYNFTVKEIEVFKVRSQTNK